MYIHYLLLVGINEEIAKAAELAFRNDNPARIFKAVVDLMKDRYLTKVTDPMSLEEILSTIKLSELKKDRRDWLYQVLYTGWTMCWLHFY